jgi:hypothetical protein
LGQLALPTFAGCHLTNDPLPAKLKHTRIN